MSWSGLSETLQVVRGEQRRRPQHGGAAGDGSAADLRHQLQREGLQDHGSQGRRQQDGEVRGDASRGVETPVVVAFYKPVISFR